MFFRAQFQADTCQNTCAPKNIFTLNPFNLNEDDDYKLTL